MGQTEIFEVLKESEKPLPRIEIAKILDERPSKISMRLNTMLKSKQVIAIEMPFEEVSKLYPNCKRRMMFFKINNKV